MRQRKTALERSSDNDDILLKAISSQQHFTQLWKLMCSNLLVPLIFIAPPILYLSFAYTKLLLYLLLPSSMFDTHVKWIGVIRFSATSVEIEQHIFRDQLLVFALGILFVFTWIMLLAAVLLQPVDWKNANALHKAVLIIFIIAGPISGSLWSCLVTREPVIRVLIALLFNLTAIVVLRFSFLPLVKETSNRVKVDRYQSGALFS